MPYLNRSLSCGGTLGECVNDGGILKVYTSISKSEVACVGAPFYYGHRDIDIQSNNPLGLMALRKDLVGEDQGSSAGTHSVNDRDYVQLSEESDDSEYVTEDE